VAGIRELLPKVEAVFYRRPESAELAELLVRMHTIAATPPMYSSTRWPNSVWHPPKPTGRAPQRASNDCAHN
jgi:hypothetical protein